MPLDHSASLISSGMPFTVMSRASGAGMRRLLYTPRAKR